MAYRQIHVKIWKDSWFIDKTVEQKLHYIYLFSNSSAGISGIYELPVRVQVFETGLSLEVIRANLVLFEEEGKIRFDPNKNVIWLLHFLKYHSNPSPYVQKGILREVAALPNCKVKTEYIKVNKIKLKVINYKVVNGIDTACIGSKEGVDRVSIPYDGNPIYNLYEGQCGKIKPSILIMLKAADKKYPVDWIRYAFKIASANNVQHWAYIQAILENWQERGKMSRGYKKYKEDEFAEFFAN